LKEAAASEEWKQYGRAVIHSMREVLGESDEPTHGHLLETADYWLSIGLPIELRRPVEAMRLLELIDAAEKDRAKFPDLLSRPAGKRRVYVGLGEPEADRSPGQEQDIGSSGRANETLAPALAVAA